MTLPSVEYAASLMNKPTVSRTVCNFRHQEKDSFVIVSLGPPPFLSAFRVPLLKHDSRLGKILTTLYRRFVSRFMLVAGLSPGQQQARAGIRAKSSRRGTIPFRPLEFGCCLLLFLLAGRSVDYLEAKLAFPGADNQLIASFE